jgi:N-acetylglucosamine-6-phosphate deacetylase
VEKKNFLLAGGRLVLPRAVVEGGSIVVRDGKIRAVLQPGERLPGRLPRIEAAGAWVTPGLVEHHIHGCRGIGFDSLGPDPKAGAEALRRARAFLRSRGVTCFVPTIVCRPNALSSLAAALEEAAFPEEEVPGIYVEGPFVNPARRGGIPLEAIREPDPAYLDGLLGLGRGRIRMMTVAPELPGAGAIIEALADAGVLPCLGHSDCSIDRITLPSGRFSITHLFNAMSPFSHKEPGLAMLPFLDGRPFVELNADGVHVNAAALRICARSMEPERLILISDAAAAAGLPYGEYEQHGSRLVSGPDGVRYADSGVLMGSNALAPDVLRRWLAATGSSPANAVRMLSLTPSQALGLEDRRGAIAPGMEADLVLWEGEFEAARELP